MTRKQKRLPILSLHVTAKTDVQPLLLLLNEFCNTKGDFLTESDKSHEQGKFLKEVDVKHSYIEGYREA